MSQPRSTDHEHAWRPPRLEGPAQAPAFAQRAGSGRLRRVVPAITLAGAWAPVGLLLWQDRPYVLDLLSHFAMHVAAVWLGLAAILVLARAQRAALAVAVPGATVLVIALWSCHVPRPGPALPGETRIRIVHYNGFQNATRGDAAFDAWLQAQDADIICVVDAPWGFWRAPWMQERYPFQVYPIEGLQWPIVILSRFPAERTRLVPLSNKNWFSFVARRSVLVTVNDSTRVLVSAMHPMSPRTPDTWRKSISFAQLDGGLLRDWSRATGLPVLLTSDCNSAPTGRLHRTFARSSGLIGWSGPLSGTWPSLVPSWLALPIDRVWTTPGLTVRRFEVGPRFNSDHRPLVIEVDLPPNSQDRSEPGQTDFGGPGPDGSLDAPPTSPGDGPPTLVPPS